MLEELQNMSEIERRTYLNNHAEKVHENDSYLYLFSDEELADMREQFVDVSLDVQNIEDEKKTAMDEFRERLKLPKSVSKELLVKLTTKMERRTGNTYILHHYDNNRIYVVTEQGHIISDRPLARGQQLSALAISKTGTGN